MSATVKHRAGQYEVVKYHNVVAVEKNGDDLQFDLLVRFRSGGTLLVPSDYYTVGVSA